MDNSPCFIIAEAGVNHNGDISLAKQLIDIAKNAGADAVKFQTAKVENCISKKAEKAPYQKETTDVTETQYEMVKKLELPYDAFKELLNYCKAQEIEFLSTPFDSESLQCIDELDVRLHKIPSGEITNYPLLEVFARTKKPVILSTGMSTLGEVEEAITYLKMHGTTEITLLHCTTSYPTPFESVNLRAMQTLAQAFHLPVGYSDHTLGISVPLAAVAMGAKVIEKHFTIDKNLPGPDHRASLDPVELHDMIIGIREIEAAFGDGIKCVAPSEKENVKIVRKSIVACKEIPVNTVITREMITVKRPGTGIEPKYYETIIGMKTTRALEEDEIIPWDSIEKVCKP